MKIYYDEGMPVMGFSDAGELRINEPKEVPDHLAKELLRKGRVKVWESASAGPTADKEENSRKGAKSQRKQED
jgi:hypothetical protein